MGMRKTRRLRRGGYIMKRKKTVSKRGGPKKSSVTSQSQSETKTKTKHSKRDRSYPSKNTRSHRSASFLGKSIHNI